MFESGNHSLEIPFALDQRQLSIGDTDYQIKVLDTQALSRQKKKAAGQVCSSRKFLSLRQSLLCEVLAIGVASIRKSVD